MSRFASSFTLLFGLIFAASCGTDPAAPAPAGSGATGNVSQSGAGGGAGGPAGGAGAGGEVSSGGLGGSAGSAGSAGSGGSAGNPGDYVVPTITWPSQACVDKAASLLAQMTNEQKAAQMVMGNNGPVANVGNMTLGNVFAGGGTAPNAGDGQPTPQNFATMLDSYIAAANGSTLGIPILYGIDAVHGHNAAIGAVVFPHNIGLGASNNPALVEEVAAVTAKEVAATGITWTFAPMLSVSFDDRWGRVYESYSEDPAAVSLLGAAATLGLQGRGGLGTGAPGIVACAKHFAGDGQATYGTSSKGGTVDRGNVQIDEPAMRALGIVPYELSLQAGLGSVMVSDARWNGENMTGHEHLMTTILKGEMGFPGFISTDWEAAAAAGGAVAAAEAGVDMFMAPNDWATIRDQLASGLSQGRLDDAARRILTVKCEAGLFEWTRDPALLASVGSAEHREVGRRAVRESLVLLQNDNAALPIAKGSNVWVGGSGADDLDNQCGGWTISWQGSGSETVGTTVLDAIGKVATVVGTIDEAETAVVVLSEPPYAEFTGDTETIDTLDPEDFALLASAKAAGKKVVAVIFSGRPVLITSHLANADAWVAAWLPGTEGDGIADVLFGDYPPTGKLPHSWPASPEQASMNKDDPGFQPLFAFGHGLTY